MPRPGGATAIANTAASTTDGTLTTEGGVALAAPSTRQKIVVLAIACVAGGTATNLTFNSKGSGAGTAISPLLANAANGGAVLPFNPVGWFSTNLGETLTVTTGTGSATGINVVYKII
jgi:hypothetical protein